MTAKKDLKRRVRERQAETGESYVTARRHVIDAVAPAPPKKPAIAVDEMVDLTETAASMGFACRVHSSSKLGTSVQHEAMLVRLRTILHGTTDDPAFEKFRAVCFRGERTDAVLRHPDWLDNLRQFVQRAQVGLGGISESGTMLAYPVDGYAGSVMVLAHVGARPVAKPPLDRPRLVLSAVIEEGFSMSTVFVP